MTIKSIAINTFANKFKASIVMTAVVSPNFHSKRGLACEFIPEHRGRDVIT